MKITDGMRLESFDMVICAMKQGFSLKIVENVFVEGEKLDEQTGKYVHWSGTEIQTHYQAYVDERSIIEQYLTDGELFAVPQSEWLESLDWDDYDE